MMASGRSLQLWMILVLLPALGAIEWRVLHAPFGLLRITHVATGGASLDATTAGYEVVGFFAHLIVPAIVVGSIVSFVATALGPARIRALLVERRVWPFGAGATALICVAQTGFIWAAQRQDDFGTVIWGVAIVTSYQVFVLVWLMLATRAASAVQPLRAGLQLIGAAIGTFSTAHYALVLLMTFLGGAPESLAVWALVVVLLTAWVVLPPAILTCGVAALVTGLRGLASGAPVRRAGDQQD